MDTTDLILGILYLMLLATVVATAFSVVRSFRMRDDKVGVENRIPVSRIAWLTAGLLVLLLIVFFAAASTHPLVINGQSYTDTFWLRTSDMLINTSLVLIFVAVCAVLFGISGGARKLKNR